MRKDKATTWLVLGLCFFGLSVLAHYPWEQSEDTTPSVALKIPGVELRLFKGTALMLQAQPPLFDHEVNTTITLPPVDFTMLPEIPPEIDSAVLANEDRSFMLIISDITIDARYMSMYEWWMEIRLYGHEEGVETWTLFMTHNVTAPFFMSWNFQEINQNRWVATLREPIKIYINLQYIIWKTLSDVYPLHLAIDIRVKGAIELSYDATGCDYMVSDPYQQSIRIVAP